VLNAASRNTSSFVPEPQVPSGQPALTHYAYGVDMDQAISKQLTITQQVQECLDAGMRADDGHQYVGIYITGYSLIVSLIRISKEHSDPQVRDKAKSYLDEFDKRGGIGTLYREAYRFSMGNRIKGALPRRKGERGLRTLKASEKLRIDEFAHRTDLSHDELSEVKRIQASIIEDRITGVDYDKIRKIIINHSDSQARGTRGKHGKHGWKKITNKEWTEMQALINRPDVSDADKKQMFQLLDRVQDEKMRTIDYMDAHNLVVNNRASKEERAKRGKASDTFENAIFMACQACDNLGDMKLPIIPRTKRVSLVAKISRAALGLMQLQNQLIYEEDADDS
jgi:hypothetical protein